jgi:YVTN family beta-propeller protein
LEQTTSLENQSSLFPNSEGERLGYLVDSYSSNRAVTKFSREEYKGFGFSEPPLTQSVADGDTTLINDPFIALGDKTPVILIHGIHGETDNGYFDNLIYYLGKLTSFNAKYKIYRFGYRSDKYSVYDIAASLRNRIDDLVRQNSQLKSKQFIIIAHSMGGLVARSYMNQHNTDYGGSPYQGLRAGERIKKVITLGTPHHGTQAYNSSARGGPDDWQLTLFFLDQVYWTHGTSCAACATDIQHPNRADLLWDNYNGEWNNNLAYTRNGAEQNGFLRTIPHTYDYKIIAYWGTIYNTKTSKYSGFSAKDFQSTASSLKLGLFSTDHTKLAATSVLLQRIVSRNFNSPLAGLMNDGAVDYRSAKFDGYLPSTNTVFCSGYDHADLKNGKNTTCGDGLSLFASVLRNIESSQSTAVLSQRVKPTAASVYQSNEATAATPGMLTISAGGYGAVTFGSGSNARLEDQATIYNLGDTSVRVNSLSLGGNNPDQFVMVNPPALPITIGPLGSLDIAVQFRPTSRGDKTATLTANNDSTNPTANIELNGFGLPADCDITLSPSSRYIPVGGGSGSFTVPTMSCPWVANTNFPWIHINVIGQTVNYTVDSNPSGELRFGQINVEVSGIIYPFGVIQNKTFSGCSLTLSETQRSFTQGAANSTLQVSTPDNCTWSASSDSPWISVNTFGLKVGTQSLSYSLAANPSPSLRFGTITVQGQDTTQVFTVSQDASTNTCTYSLSTIEQALPANDGQSSFTIRTGAGCRWQVSTPDRWITINSANNGLGSETISYTADANLSTSARLGDISVQGSGQTPLLLTVRQNGQPAVPSNISLPATSIQMGDALVNSTIYQSVVINNTGLGYLFLGSIYQAAGVTDFDVLPYAQNQIIAPGGGTSITIKLTPTSTGSRSATFSISSNDPNQPIVNFSISGNGVTQITGGIDFVWSNKSTIPESYFEYASSAVINNNIYVIGGDFSGTNYRYDPTLNNWTQIAQSPNGGVGFGGADAINGKIYVVGRQFGDDRIQIYNSANNSWTLGAATASPAEGMAVAAANGKLYAIGGGSSPTNIIREYDPGTDTWTTTKAPMPTARAYAAVAVVNNLIYVIGGFLPDGQRSVAVEVFNPANNTWSTRENIPTQRSSARAVVVNNKIEVIGGSQGGPDTINVVEEHDPSLPGPFGTWFQRNHILTARADFVAGVVNGKIYVIGGRANNTGHVTSVEEGVLAASPKINVPVTNFNCGDVPLGNFCDKRIEVQNQGNAQLVISNFGRSSGSGDFISFFGNLVVDAGQSTSLVVRFTPTSSGSKTATFLINSNDPSTPSLTLNLSANVVAALPTSGTWQIVNTIQLSNPSKQPTQIAIANGRAYVSRYPASVSVVDLSSGTTVSEIQFSAYPSSDVQSIAISGNRAYVVLGNPGRVAVVNTDSNSVLSYITVSGARPLSVAVTDTSVYVPNNGPDTVSVIDRSTNSVTNTIPVSTGAVWIAIDSNSGKAYVTGKYQGCNNGNGACISAIDTATNAVVSTISVPTPYSGGSIVLSSTRAYFSTEASVEVLDLSSNSPVASIPVPRYANGNAIAATAEYAFVGSSGANVSVINTTTNLIAGKLTVNSPNSIAIDPVTGLVYVVDYNDSIIKVLRFVSPGFSVATNAQSLAAIAGGNTVLTTTVTSIDGFSGAVNLSCEGLPTGATCQFSQNPVNVPANGSVSTTLTVNVPAGTIPGPYSLRVVGSGSAPQNAISNSKATLADVASTTTLTDFQNLSLTVPSCDFALSAQSISVGAGPSTRSVDVAGTTGCSWTAVSNDAWISITSGASGSGNGTVSYSVTANTDPTPRTGTLTVAGQTFTFTQAAATYTINGRVADGSGGSIKAVTISLSGTQTLSTQTDSDGNYSFANLATGNYTITPAKTNYTFNPGSQTFNSLSTNQTANFTGTPVTYNIVGQVTISNVSLGGVTVTLEGSKSQTATTDSSGNYQFTNLLAGGNYTVTPAKTNYTFTPQNQTFNNLSVNQTVNFTATLNPGVPILISEETSTRAIALDSVLWLRDPFQLNSPVPWGVDRRTRVMLFAMNFDLLPGENISVMTADAEDASHRIYPLTVEYVGRIPGFDWLSCVIIRLNDDMGDIGDVLVRINVRGVSSNRVRMGIGHTGGGPLDDLGAVPTPGRPPQ